MIALRIGGHTEHFLPDIPQMNPRTVRMLAFRRVAGKPWAAATSFPRRFRRVR